jgi:hypothetical protein
LDRRLEDEREWTAVRELWRVADSDSVWLAPLGNESLDPRERSVGILDELRSRVGAHEVRLLGEPCRIDMMSSCHAASPWLEAT